MIRSSLIEFRDIGRHMPRRRIERGYVYRIGKTTKMWEGRYHVYVTLPDGTEKRRERTKILGACSEMSKGDAKDALVREIARARGHAGPLPDNPTFSEVWIRYRTLKEPTWSTATKRAIVSIFEGASKKKKRPSISAMIGGRRAVELTRDPLQECLNQMAARGDSFSAVKKARTYIAAALEYALDERLIGTNPARKLELPGNRLRKPCGRFYGMEEIRRLLSSAANESLREHLIVRLFVICGLRAQELFVLRVDDIESGILRIDEALKEWTAAPDPNDLLFPTETGTPFRIGNYLKRVLKPLAVKAGVPDLTYQALRRTFATHFQRYGSPKDAQTQLRHSKLEMTGWYMKEIPETVRTAVEKMDSDICRQEEKQPETPGSIQ